MVFAFHRTWTYIFREIGLLYATYAAKRSAIGCPVSFVVCNSTFDGIVVVFYASFVLSFFVFAFDAWLIFVFFFSIFLLLVVFHIVYAFRLFSSGFGHVNAPSLFWRPFLSAVGGWQPSIFFCKIVHSCTLHVTWSKSFHKAFSIFVQNRSTRPYDGICTKIRT